MQLSDYSWKIINVLRLWILLRNSRYTSTHNEKYSLSVSSPMTLLPELSWQLQLTRSLGLHLLPKSDYHHNYLHWKHRSISVSRWTGHKNKSSWMIWDLSQYSFQYWKTRCWSRADQVFMTPLHQPHFNLKRNLPAVTEVLISPLLRDLFLTSCHHLIWRMFREQRMSWSIYSVPQWMALVSRGQKHPQKTSLLVMALCLWKQKTDSKSGWFDQDIKRTFPHKMKDQR